MPDAAIAAPYEKYDIAKCRVMSAQELQAARVAAATKLLEQTVFKNPYLSWMVPSKRQAYFLTVPVREVLYGGCAGSGKTAALLAAALQFVTVPGYAALLLRRSFTDLALPGSLIPLSHEWLTQTPWMRKNAKWNGAEFRWNFSSGAVIQFGYINNATDKYRYQSSAFNAVFFDELTQFPKDDYIYLFSRQRKKTGVNLPLRMMSATNPGGEGHDWVKQRFITTVVPDREFVPAKLQDNLYLDQESYVASLDMLDPVTRAQLKHGDWSVRPEGNMFKRVWFRVIDRISVPAKLRRVARGWDFAATEGTRSDPDYTVGAKMALDYAGNYYVFDVQRTRSTPANVEILVKQTAVMDGTGVIIKMEEDIGSAGKMVVSHYQRNVLLGYTVIAKKPTGDKITRAKPFSAAAEQGRVYVVNGDWVDEWLSEICSFGSGTGHDDQVDASVAAFESLNDGLLFAGSDGGGQMNNVATFCTID